VTLGSHQQSIGQSQTHITPRYILDAVGPFDLDPAAAWPRPWNCAKQNVAVDGAGLTIKWKPSAFVWLNPPFDRRHIHAWMAKMASHNNGIALLHARTETNWFQPVWNCANAILFLRHRVIFHKPDGSLQTTKKGEVANSGAPVCLVAFGQTAFERLNNCQLEGSLVFGWTSK
jgi:hypothetical protein